MQRRGLVTGWEVLATFDWTAEGVIFAIGRGGIVSGNNPANLGRLGKPIENPAIACGENSERDGIVDPLALPLSEG